MGIQIIGNGGVVVGAAEEASKPLHVARHPKDGNFYRYSGQSGTIAAALAAASELFQFRFVAGAKSFALVHKVEVQSAIVAVGTAIGPHGFELVPARSWSVAGSGGTRISTAGDNLQTETAENASQVNDMGIATTGALTVGTKTLDANAQGNALSGILTGAATVQQTAQLLAKTPLWQSDEEGDMPLVLAGNEGFVVRTTHVGPAALTYVFAVHVVWSEVTAF